MTPGSNRQASTVELRVEHCSVVGEIRGWARDLFFRIGTAI